MPIFRQNKKYRKKSGKKSDLKYKDTKGFWEYSNNQKIVEKNKEEQIKRNLRFLGGFDPSKVESYINPSKSKEELIDEKENNGERLTNGEKIILNNWREKKERLLQKDLDLLLKFKLNADVSTEQGKMIKLLNTLEYVIKKGDINMTSLIYLKLKDKKESLTDSLKLSHKKILDEMNKIASKVNLVELQMTKLHSCQPPLDQTGFSKLDDFQIDVITNIDNDISTIVSAPTSSGKSVISGYSFTKGKTLVVVPSDPLAWQMATYIGNILDKSIPIITKSYQTSPKRDELIEIVNKSNALVGTADAILDFLPLIKVDYDWIVYDEIHMIGKKEGSSMEHLAKLFCDKPFLALSATIGNIDHLKQWFESTSNRPVSVVSCNKRFFNLQRFIYSTERNNLERIHPLGLIDISDIENKSILKKALQPTPPDIWDFAVKLSKELPLGNLDPSKYFDKDVRITLDMSNLYFEKLIEKTVQLYKGKNIPKIKKIIESYQQNLVRTEHTDLMKLLFKLKEIKKCPAIVFQANSTSCMRLARQFARQVEIAESEKYPNLVDDRLREEKKAKKIEKENDKKKVEDIKDNKLIKLQMKEGTTGDENDKNTNFEVPTVTPVQEPHKDFIFNSDQFFAGAVVEKWVSNLKNYFPNRGDDYHWLIIMLWRGVGVYVKGLPDDYLRLVQELASSKKLAIVFSDESLVFGVSMPFRTTVVLRDVLTADDLDSMMYHQMSGRAGRRGLDTEGNVVFAGYSWDRIKELSISCFPNIEGEDTMIFPIDVSKDLAKKYNNKLDWDLMKTNFLHDNVTNEVSKEFYDDITENIKDGGWEFVSNEDKNHNHMVWKLRHDMDSISVPMILSEVKKIFDVLDPKAEKNQIEAALYLSHFIHLKEATDDKYVLPECSNLTKGESANLKEYAENKGIEIPEKIDSKVYETIVKNKLVDLGSEAKNDKLRDRLFEFSEKVRCIQHYFFHTNAITVARLLGKLLTRIWWCYHTSSPLMRSLKEYESEIMIEQQFEMDSDSDEYETDSDDEESNLGEEEYIENNINV